MIRFFAYTESEIQHKQQIINFAHKFHLKYPNYTYDTSQMMGTPRMAFVFNMLGVSHYRLVAKYDVSKRNLILYQQADPEIKTVKGLRDWLSQRDVHICMGATGRPVSFHAMWDQVFKMNQKDTQYTFAPYPGSFDPQFKANPSDYIRANEDANQAAKMVVFSRSPKKHFTPRVYVPHVYVISDKRSFGIARELWKDLYQMSQEFGEAMTLPTDAPTKTMLIQEFVKYYRLTFIKMNDIARPVVYVRAAYTVLLDIGMLESDRFRVEEWKRNFHPVSKEVVKKAFVNDALVPNQWYPANKHKPTLSLYDFDGAYVPHYRYIYDLRIPSVTHKGAYSMLDFDIVPGKKPVTDKRTNEVLRPMKETDSKSNKK